VKPATEVPGRCSLWNGEPSKRFAPRHGPWGCRLSRAPTPVSRGNRGGVDLPNDIALTRWSSHPVTRPLCERCARCPGTHIRDERGWRSIRAVALRLCPFGRIDPQGWCRIPSTGRGTGSGPREHPGGGERRRSHPGVAHGMDHGISLPLRSARTRVQGDGSQDRECCAPSACHKIVVERTAMAYRGR
jgi:hypothetical protein